MDKKISDMSYDELLDATMETARGAIVVEIITNWLLKKLSKCLEVDSKKKAIKKKRGQ